MSRIVFPADNQGEAIAYVEALTGAQNVVIPPGPSPAQLGKVLKVESKLVSVSASADLGFGFASTQANMSGRVLVQDYWFLAEILGTIPEVNSWTFATGFRVGLFTTDAKLDFSLGIGILAAKAQIQQASIQIHILRVGMPSGPDVPASLAIPTALDVDKFGELKGWEASVIKYHEEHRSDETPLLVSASVNIKGDKLLTDAPGVRYALWRISAGQTLKQAVALLAAGKAPGVDEGQVRAVYAAMFANPRMVIPGDPSEQTPVTDIQKKAANGWLTGYRNL
jgi:hypothetical protein